MIFSTVSAIIVFGGMVNYFWEQKNLDMTLTHLDSIASLQEHRIESSINQNFERLRGLTNHDSLLQDLQNYLETNNPEKIENIRATLIDNVKTITDFHKIVIVSPDGKNIVSTEKDLEFTNFAEHPAFNAGKNDYFMVNEVDEHSHMIMSGPLMIDQKLLGVLIIDLEPFVFFDVTQNYSGLGKSGEILLAQRTESGDALFITPLRFDSEAAFSKIISKDQEEFPITRALAKQEGNFIDTIDYRGEKVLSSTRYIEKGDLGLVAKMDYSEVYSFVFDSTILLVGVVIVLSGVMASFSLLLSDKIIRPITRLKSIVNDLEQGKYSKQIAINENNEVRDVMESFQKLSINLKENRKTTKEYEKKLQNKLQESNNLRNALDNSSIVVITDKKGLITSVNKKFEEISKYSKKELIGKNQKLLISNHHPSVFHKSIWKIITRGDVWQGRIKNITKNGLNYWTFTTITPFLGDDGKPEQYIAVQSDITKEIEQNLLIQKQYKKLKEDDIKKEEFASMVSHELKTPLTPIKFNTEMLIEPNALGNLNSNQLESLGEIEINTNRLENLISDILYAQKLDMKKMIFNKKKFSIENLVSQISKNMHSLLQEKHISLEIINSYSEDICSDNDRIQQVLENLIKNSVDFVSEGSGKITIGIQKNGDTAKFYVKDNGIGIPKDKQQNLFKKFYQVDTSHTRKHGGTGLGLVICKGFIEGLGGKIWCESNKGQGVTFFFTIPINQMEVVA